jgi:ubiquinone/menaquinone biosynthesis C-methylase UbiE
MKRVKDFYNNHGIREWHRLNKDAHSRLNLALHQKFLLPHIGKAKKVLDAGCGSGRFSVFIAESGSEITLLDISEKQIEIARYQLERSRVEQKVDRYIVADILNLKEISNEIFDTTVCFGGVLNYLGSSLQKGLRELKRVTKKGGVLVLSVNSLYGGLFRYIIANEHSIESKLFQNSDSNFWKDIIQTGNLLEISGHPERHFFTSKEIEQILIKEGFSNITFASSPSISFGLYDQLNRFEESESKWDLVLSLEESLFDQPELINVGEFLLIKCIKTQ